MTNPAPGWYPHPDGTPGKQAYWDQNEWHFEFEGIPPTQAMSQPFPQTREYAAYPPTKTAWGPVVAVASVALVVVLALVVGLVAATSDSDDAGGVAAPAPTSARSAPPETPRSTTRTPTTTQSPKAKMQAWLNSALPEIEALESAFDAMANSTSSDSAMAKACSEVLVSVANLRGKLPSPDAAVNTELTAALDLYARGSATCSRLDSGNVTPEEITDAANKIEQGNSRLTTALQLTKQLGG